MLQSCIRLSRFKTQKLPDLSQVTCSRYFENASALLVWVLPEKFPTAVAQANSKEARQHLMLNCRADIGLRLGRVWRIGGSVMETPNLTA